MKRNKAMLGNQVIGELEVMGLAGAKGKLAACNGQGRVGGLAVDPAAIPDPRRPCPLASPGATCLR